MFRSIYLSGLIIFFLITKSLADPGDTIKVQTFTFGSSQDGWFVLPSLDIDVEKILMKYTLKCNPAQSPACGEWDYLTYTYLYDHTGMLDSTLLTHANFEVNGTAPDSVWFSDSQTFAHIPNWYYGVVHDDTISLNNFQLGSGDLSVDFPFGSAEPRSKSQFIWSAWELNNAGLVAGEITGLQFYFESAGSIMHDVRIAIAEVEDTVFENNFYVEDFLEVARLNILPDESGWYNISFTEPFVWDGISSIIAQVSFDNTEAGENTFLKASDIGMQRSVYSSGADRYLDITDPMYASVIGNPLELLNESITVSWWSYGDTEFQPQNGTTFEVYNSSGNRLLNVHGPWSDGNIYWDAGASGGSYDRIYKNALASDYEGNWTHWAFTKDADGGVMKIYKNGIEWHSGTGKTFDMTDALTMRIGKGLWAGSQSYYGWLNEFAIWNAVLDVATIQNYMYQDVDDAHPFAENLLLYYSFDNGFDWFTNDDSDGDALLANFGTQSRLIPAGELYRNISSSNLRPDVIWEQGIFSSHLDSIIVMDTVENDPMTIVIFDPENPTMGIDTLLAWPGGYYNYIFATDGSIDDSIFVSNSDVLYKELYTYYSPSFEVIDRYELARYITPYGIGLDLGDGFTWTFDLSDYRPLLHDSVHLTAGNWQELLSMELWFIEGTPPRKPLSVTNLWTGFKPFDSDESFDDNTPPIVLTIPDNAVNSRVKVRTTGHGFGGNLNCAEFCKMEHYFKVEGDIKWTQEIWRDDCDVNPVYPQGGTWVYDRANWCPGAEVGTYDFELTNHVIPGSEFTFDYASSDYLWNGGGSFPYYQTEVQLITYDEPFFLVDAAIMDIVAPTNDQIWGRKNPICNDPIVRIQNTGSETLTILKIEYGLQGATIPTSVFNWTGSLEMMEWEEVQLTDYAWSESGIFQVTVSEPNGIADAYSFNNSMITEVNVPATIPNKIILEFKTNLRPTENDLFLYNSIGEEVFSRTTFTASTVYKDTLELTDDCYTLYLWDYGEDGIAWWANSDGSGYFRMKDGNTGTIIKNYEPDFGGLVYQQFTVGNYVDINTLEENGNALFIYPNPTDDIVFFDVQLINADPVTIWVYNLEGKLVYTDKTEGNHAHLLSMDASVLPSGLYVALVNAGDQIMKSTFIIEH